MLEPELVHTTYAIGNRQAEFFQYESGAGDLWLSIPGIEGNKVFTLEKQNALDLAYLVIKHFREAEEPILAQDCFDSFMEPFKGTEKY